MPEIQHYLVTQTRQVKVSAQSAKDAGIIASAAFENGQNGQNGVRFGPRDVWGNTEDKIRETSLLVEKVR